MKRVHWNRWFLDMNLYIPKQQNMGIYICTIHILWKRKRFFFILEENKWMNWVSNMYVAPASPHIHIFESKPEREFFHLIPTQLAHRSLPLQSPEQCRANRTDEQESKGNNRATVMRALGLKKAQEEFGSTGQESEWTEEEDRRRRSANINKPESSAEPKVLRIRTDSVARRRAEVVLFYLPNLSGSN